MIGKQCGTAKLAIQIESGAWQNPSVRQYPVMEYFRARQIGYCDVDVTDQGVTSIFAGPADTSPITAASAKPACAKIANT